MNFRRRTKDAPDNDILPHGSREENVCKFSNVSWSKLYLKRHDGVLVRVHFRRHGLKSAALTSTSLRGTIYCNLVGNGFNAATCSAWGFCGCWWIPKGIYYTLRVSTDTGGRGLAPKGVHHGRADILLWKAAWRGGGHVRLVRAFRHWREVGWRATHWTILLSPFAWASTCMYMECATELNR